MARRVIFVDIAFIFIVAFLYLIFLFSYPQRHLEDPLFATRFSRYVGYWSMRWRCFSRYRYIPNT
jgi:hypothetical protein